MITTGESENYAGWSPERLRQCSSQVLQSKLSEAKKNYQYASWLKQSTARLMWESRINSVNAELRQRENQKPLR